MRLTITNRALNSTFTGSTSTTLSLEDSYDEHRQKNFAMLSLAGWLTTSVVGQTASPNKVFGRYQQFVWQEQHGLPQNTVIAATRSRDGYLWFGTIEGAARFDGVRFTVFESSNTSAIRGNRVFALLEDRFNNLWMTTVTGGLTKRSADGRFTHFSTREGLSDDHTTCLLEDRRAPSGSGRMAAG
jgi:hypothetical protein